MKAHRLAIRRVQEAERGVALAELAAHAGMLDGRKLSSAARAVLLELHARALADHAANASRDRDSRTACAEYRDPSADVGIRIHIGVDGTTEIHSPDGDFTFYGMAIEILVGAQDQQASAASDDDGMQERSA